MTALCTRSAWRMPARGHRPGVQSCWPLHACGYAEHAAAGKTRLAQGRRFPHTPAVYHTASRSAHHRAGFLTGPGLQVHVALESQAVPLLHGVTDIMRAGVTSSLHTANSRIADVVTNSQQAVLSPLWPALVDPQTSGAAMHCVTFCCVHGDETASGHASGGGASENALCSASLYAPRVPNQTTHQAPQRLQSVNVVVIELQAAPADHRLCRKNFRLSEASECKLLSQCVPALMHGRA